MKFFLVIGLMAFIGLNISNAQRVKETTCNTWQVETYLDCVDELLKGEITYCGTLWYTDGVSDQWQGRWVGNFTGSISGDTYTFQRTDNINSHEWNGTVSHWKMVRNFSVYREGVLIGEWHINTKDLWNVNQDGQLVDVENWFFYCYN